MTLSLSAMHGRKSLAMVLTAVMLASGLGFILRASAQDTTIPNPPTGNASGFCFLKIDGIQGESTGAGHGGEIDVESWSWGESNAGSFGVGRGGAGKVSMQDFHFMKRLDKSSPKLFLAVATGEHIKNAVLTCRKAGGDQQEYLMWTLSDVMVSSYQVSSAGSDRPMESLSLNFTKIEFEYKPQSADGSSGAPVKAGYDLKLNKKV